MKVFVTGASGFIGSKLIPELFKRGYEIRSFGRSDYSGQPANYPVEHVKGDIADPAAVASALAGCQLVFHLAGLVSYRSSDQKRQYRVNVVGTRNVLEAALKAGVSRLIHTSSIAAMGIPPDGFIGDESIVYNLRGRGLAYCDTKHLGEQEVLKYAGLGLPAIILNPGIVLGEGDSHPHHKAVMAMLSKGMIGWPSGGVSFCDINDVVSAHLDAIEKGRLSERYVLSSSNLTYREAALYAAQALGVTCTGSEIPGFWLDLAGMLCETFCPAFGLKPPLTRQIAWLSQQKIFFSAGKAVKELGYRQTPFAETIKRTARYYLGSS